MSAMAQHHEAPRDAPERGDLYARINEGILEERLRLFRRNLELNAPLVRRHGGLAPLIQLAKDRHVVVIGAGPSLDRALPLLRKFRDRRELCYIAADMALRPLAAVGINPVMVFTCETTPVDFFRGIDTTRLLLAAFCCSSPVNLRPWRGRLAFYNWMIHTADYDALWERAGTDLGFVATGNTVTTQAVSFALGCAPRSLILVGNDLGFTSAFYARGTGGHEKLAAAADRFVPAESGEAAMARRHRQYELRRGSRVFFTNHQFLAAKYWLEDLFAGAAVPVYDTGEPGCAGRGVTHAALGELFSGFERHASRKRR